ncbi:glycosyltransferase [Gloeocapsopsis sp. AAB1 = 1H9]|uniref:Glycosyltransferase n=1 Tax=Gloeocapsopsis dulcis AAB1 = 1H9 TaxID=1433147 RepID=A0A6N8FPA8_9CHRO|nr:glycosyltransferase [Gloeocapsopsis dulcis AAB1 = 1H9]
MGSINKRISAINTVANTKEGCRLIPLQHQHYDAQPDNSTNTQKLHIALYSHDTMGLGHKRRNLLIAQTLAKSSLQASILLITGMGEACNFDIPPGIDYLALPALRKQVDGKYQSRRLELPLQDIIALRSRTIRAALEAFKPDVFIVDNVPRGAVGELNFALEYLKSREQTHCILGLRDVLDAPVEVHREWQRVANEEAICQYYDAVWIYGDPTVYDPVQEYNFSPEVTKKVRYTGYFDQRQRLQFNKAEADELLASLELPPGHLALCLVGGGQDGAYLAEVFANATLPPETNGIIVTGPFMPSQARQQLHQKAQMCSRLRVLDVAEPTQLLHHADCVVAMGGYNTTCELLSFGKRSLIVPRVEPRTEQLIRAQRLHELGLTDLLHPNDVNPQTITAWLEQDRQLHPKQSVNLNGLERLPDLLSELVTQPSAAQSRAS